MEEKIVKEFKEKLETFCHLSFKFGEFQNKQILLKNELLSTKAWKLQEYTGTSSVVQTSTNQLVPFTYKYSSYTFDSKVFEGFRKSLEKFDTFFNEKYLGQYFTEQVFLQTVLYELLEEKGAIPADYLFLLMKVVLDTMKNPSVPLYEYTLSILKEFAFFIGYLLMERVAEEQPGKKKKEKGSSSNNNEVRSKLVMKILETIIEQNAFNTLVPIFQPRAQDLLVEDYLKYLTVKFSQEKTINSDHLTVLLRQIPFDMLRKSDVRHKEMAKYVLTPLVDLMSKISFKANKRAFVHMCKILRCLCDQYPRFNLEILSAMTRQPWPGRVVALGFVKDFPFERIDLASRKVIFQECFNLFATSWASVKDKDVVMNKFLNEYYLPWIEITRDVHNVLLSDIAVKNKDGIELSLFPFLQMLENMAKSSSSKFRVVSASDSDSDSDSGERERKNEKVFFVDMITLMYSLSFKAGSRVKDNLKYLGMMRKEGLRRIVNVVNSVRDKDAQKIAISVVLRVFVEEFLQFLHATQPHVLEKLHPKFFSLIDMKGFELSARDTKVCIVGVLNNAKLSGKFKQSLLGLIDWELQPLKIVLLVLNVILAKGNESVCTEEMLNKFSRPVRDEKECEAVSQFLKSIEYKTDRKGVFNSIRCFFMLSIAKWERQNEKINEIEMKERLGLIQTAIQNSKIGVLNAAILKLYVQLTCTVKDYRDFTRGGVYAGVFSEKLLQKLPQMFEMYREKKPRDYVKFIYVLSLIVLDDFSRSKNFGHLERLIVNEFLWMWKSKCGENARKLLFRPFEKAVGEFFSDHEFGTSSQQTVIMKMIQQGSFLTAFIFTSCFPCQLPPVEEVSLDKSAASESSGFSFDNESSYDAGYFMDEALSPKKRVLNTQVESALWIAAEIGQKLIEQGKEFLSLMFWQHFFELYFKLEESERNIGEVFPAYLRQRLNRSFNDAADGVRKKDKDLEKVALLFQSFQAWEKEGVLGGTKFIWRSRILQGLILKSTGIDLLEVGDSSSDGDETENKESGEEEGEKKKKKEEVQQEVYSVSTGGHRGLSRRPFLKEISRYNHFRMKVEETFSDTSVLGIFSLDQESLFSRELLDSFDTFCKYRAEYDNIQAVYSDIVRSLYQIVEVKEHTTLNVQGETINASFAVKKSKLSHDGNVVELLDANRLKLKDVQMKLLENLEKISFLYSSLTRITNEMAGNVTQFGSTALTFHVTVMPYLLDLKKAKLLMVIYPQMVAFVASLGKKYSSGHPKIQMNILIVLLKSLGGLKTEEDEKEVRSVRLTLYKAGGGSGFNPELVFQENNNFDNNRKNSEDYLDILETFVEVCGEMDFNESNNTDEITHVASCFEMSYLFRHVKEVYPDGSRLTLDPPKTDQVVEEEVEDEGEIDLSSLAIGSMGSTDEQDEEEKKKSVPERMNYVLHRILSNQFLQSSVLGEVFLTRCFQLCFPREVDRLLGVILKLSQEGSYKGRWDKILFGSNSKLDLGQVDADLALTWIKTINMYQPYENHNNVASVVAIRSIVMGTKLQGVIKRSSLQGENIETILNIFSIYFSSNSNFQLTYEFFLNLLIGFKNFVTEFPFLIDIVWDYYFNHFHPFALKNSMKFRQQLTTLMLKFPFENATFHASSTEKTLYTIQTLYQVLPYDPVTVCTVFSKTDWSFMKKCVESTLLVNFVFLISDIRMFDPKAVPKWVDNFFTGSNEMDSPLWMKLNPNELAACLQGNTLMRMIITLTVPQDGSDPAVQLLSNLRWFVEVCLNLKSEMFAVALASEIENMINFCVKTVNETSSWALKNSQNVELLRFLFALTSNYYYNSRIVQTLFVGAVDRFSNDVPVLVNSDFKFDGFRTPSDPLLMKEKFCGMINQFVTSLTVDEILKSYLKLVPSLARVDMDVMKFFFPLLEEIIKTYLKLTTESEARSKCCNYFTLSDEVLHNEIHMSKMVDGCVKYHCPMLLTMILLKQIEDMVVNKKDSVDNLRNTYFYCMETSLQYIPEFTGDGFDYMFVMLFMLEIIQSDFFDMSYTITKDLVNKFKGVVEYLAEKLDSDDSSSWKKLKSLLKKTELPWKVGKHPKVPEQIAISARLIEIYLEKVLKQKKSKLGSGFQLLSSTNPSQFVNQSKVTKLSKLRPRFKMHDNFFKEIENLKQFQFDLFALKLILRNLFPLCDYLFK